MTIYTKAEFEEEIREILRHHLLHVVDVEVIGQEVTYDRGDPSLVKVKLVIPINGYIKDLEQRLKHV